jgi:hypothetical protein
VLLAIPFGAPSAEFNRRRNGDCRSLTSHRSSRAERLPNDVVPSYRQSAHGLRNELLFLVIR